MVIKNNENSFFNCIPNFQSHHFTLTMADADISDLDACYELNYRFHIKVFQGTAVIVYVRK